MADPVILAQVASLIKTAPHIFVAAHIMPDGDCLGSQLGLAGALRALGKQVTLSLDDWIPDVYHFLPGVREIASRPPNDEDLFIYVDGSDASRYGKAYDRQLTGTRLVINIDHHSTNEPFADYNLVDTAAAATAEIVYDLIQVLDAPMDQNIAQALLTGIVTDTLGFRTAATRPETLEKATALMRRGASIPEVIEHVYNRRSYNSLRLLSRVIADSHLKPPLIWSQVSQPTLHELGIQNNGTGGIVNTLLSVADAAIAFFLAEKDDGRIDLGIRSRAEIDISGVARRLGGGGHKQAAGATLPPPLETAADRVLAAMKEELNLS